MTNKEKDDTPNLPESVVTDEMVMTALDSQPFIGRNDSTRVWETFLPKHHDSSCKDIMRTALEDVIHEMHRAANARADGLDIVGWINEDMLPDGYPYDAMFPYSAIDVVRVFPVYAPIALRGDPEMEPWAIDDLRATSGKGDAAQAVRSEASEGDKP